MNVECLFSSGHAIITMNIGGAFLYLFRKVHTYIELAFTICMLLTITMILLCLSMYHADVGYLFLFLRWKSAFLMAIGQQFLQP